MRIFIIRIIIRIEDGKFTVKNHFDLYSFLFLAANGDRKTFNARLSTRTRLDFVFLRKRQPGSPVVYLEFETLKQ